jgi:ABC-type antimicrobial peptide transport system permease subunit
MEWPTGSWSGGPGNLAIRTALGATAALRPFLFGGSPADATNYAMAIGLVLCAAFAATWLPARRAIRLDPMRALRSE